jgi:hypothetical protein
MGETRRPPLSALLSQVLVALTVEFDNEFELQMGNAGYVGARLSFVVWANLMRFLAESSLSVHALTACALAAPNQMKTELGCLERWGFITLQEDSSGSHAAARRDGFGSGRGIKKDWLVHLTKKGLVAAKIWPPLSATIETRWQNRFGSQEIQRLQEILQKLARQLELELPQGLPSGLDETFAYPPHAQVSLDHLPLSALLSQLLLTFRLEFDHESRTPLALCANTLRVLSDKPIRVSELPRLTGTSPEMGGIGWQIKPYVLVESDPLASRGKVVRLSPPGLKAQQAYAVLTTGIEKRWESRFGKDTIDNLRNSLLAMLERRLGDKPLLSEGLMPPKGTVRAGDQAPALGRRNVGSAARQRMRDLVAQTEAFVEDPAGALPHYPLWDFNRGFGP